MRVSVILAYKVYFHVQNGNLLLQHTGFKNVITR